MKSFCKIFNIRLFVFLFVSLFFVSESFGWMAFDIGVIFQKGVGQNLTLKSEMYIRERKFVNRDISFITPNKIAVTIEASFIDDILTYGPSSLIQFKAEIIDIKQEIKIFEGKAYVDEKKEFSFHQGSDQIVRLEVTPRLF